MPAHNLYNGETMTDNVVAPESNEVKVRTFIIPSPNMPKFTEKLEKLVKRAKRIGCEIPSYTVVKEELKAVKVVIGETEDARGVMCEVTEERMILMTHIVFNSSEVVVAGHEFCATIEHTEEGNILRTLEGKTLPHKYRECGPWCDHCKTMRRRNDTFVVRHVESNTYLQVGRNCLADFLGRDAERCAAMAELMIDVGELALASEEEGTGGWGARGERVDHLDSYLAFVAEVIALKGWRSRSTAKEYGGQSTADIAHSHMHPTPEFKKYGEVLFHTPTDKSVQVAKDAIAWCEALSDSEVEASEYLHNIRVIARRGIVAYRQLGYAASIVSGYQRHVGDLKRKESFAQQALVSQYVGEVGTRAKFVLTVEHVVALPDYGFGSSSLHLMSDKLGNRFTWKSSSYTLDKGKEVLLKGTVKEHSEYKGVKQTVLSRCEELTLKTYTTVVCGATYEVPAESEKEALKMLRETLKVAKLPKGTTMTEKVCASVPVVGGV